MGSFLSKAQIKHRDGANWPISMDASGLAVAVAESLVPARMASASIASTQASKGERDFL